MRGLGLAAAFAALLCANAPAVAAGVDACAQPAPDTSLKGMVSGQPFAPDNVTIYKQRTYGNDGKPYDSYYLTFRVGQGQDSLQVQPAMKVGTLPDGKTFRRLPTWEVKQQPKAGPDATEIQSWYLQMPGAKIETGFLRDLATLKLEFGTRNGKTLPGHLTLCIPKLGSVISGSFKAEILQNP